MEKFAQEIYHIPVVCCVMPKPMVMVINLTRRTDRKRWVELTLQPSVKDHEFQFIKAVDKSSLVSDAQANGRALRKNANTKCSNDGTCDDAHNAQRIETVAEQAPRASQFYTVRGLGTALKSLHSNHETSATSDVQSNLATDVDDSLSCGPSPPKNTQHDRTSQPNSIQKSGPNPHCGLDPPTCCMEASFRPFSKWKLDSAGLRDVRRRWNQLCNDPVHADEIAKFYGREITLSEFCCTLSHYKAWQAALLSQAPYAIVLEVHGSSWGTLNE